MARSIGPIQLRDGLYLRAPEAKPGALLRAQNIELRNGMLRTRRGSSIIAKFSTGTAINGVGNSFLNGVPNAYVGSNQIIYCWPTASAAKPQAGDLVVVAFFGFNNITPADTTVEYLADGGVWKALEAVDFLGTSGAIFREGHIPMSGINGADPKAQEDRYFVVPEDWIAQTFHASLGAGWNVRLSLSAPIGGGSAGPVSTFRVAQAVPPRMLWVEARKSSEAFIVTPSVLVGFATVYRSSVISSAKSLTANNYTATRAGSAFDLLYIPATDDILLCDGVDPQIMAAAAGSVPAPFAPATALSDPPAEAAYLDIPLESTLSGFTAMGLFGGRVFVGGFVDEPTKIRWSAPDVSWKAWPSDNKAILGGGSAGRVVTFAVFAETLFIFTTRGIWTAEIIIGDGLSESVISVKFLEATGCPSDRSVVTCDKGIFFMSDDGPRMITQRSPSKPLVPQVQDLFASDSQHPLACMRKATTCAAWDRVNQRVLFAYASTGSSTNDTVLVVDMLDKTAWLWGVDTVADLNARLNLQTSGAGATTQRQRGLRICSMDWDPKAQRVICVSPDGVLFHLDGFFDMGLPINWLFETEVLRLSAGERGIVERVEFLVAREHFSDVDCTVIPDGDLGRAETRTISAEPDRLDVTSVIGQGQLAGEALEPLEESFGPAIWRGRKPCRNFRVRLASRGTNPAPACVVACTVDVTVDNGKR